MQKMKLRMSRINDDVPPAPDGGTGGEDPFKKYDGLNVTKIQIIGDAGRSPSEVIKSLGPRGFSAYGLCRTVLGKPFEAEEFELFLLYLVDNILEVNSRAEGWGSNHSLYKNIAKFLKKYEIIDEAKFNKINSDLDNNTFKLD